MTECEDLVSFPSLYIIILISFRLLVNQNKPNALFMTIVFTVTAVTSHCSECSCGSLTVAALVVLMDFIIIEMTYPHCPYIYLHI